MVSTFALGMTTLTATSLPLSSTFLAFGGAGEVEAAAPHLPNEALVGQLATGPRRGDRGSRDEDAAVCSPRIYKNHGKDRIRKP